MSQKVLKNTQKISLNPKNTPKKASNYSNQEIIDPTEANKSVETLMKEFSNLTTGMISTALQLSNSQLPNSRSNLSNVSNWESTEKKSQNNKAKNKIETSNGATPSAASSVTQQKKSKKIKNPKNPPNNSKNDNPAQILMDVADECVGGDIQNVVDNLIGFKDQLVKEQSEGGIKYTNQFTRFRQMINDLEILAHNHLNQTSTKKIDLINQLIINLSSNSNKSKEFKSIHKKTIDSIKNDGDQFEQNFNDILRKLEELLEKTKNATQITNGIKIQEEMNLSPSKHNETIQKTNSRNDLLKSNVSQSPILIRTSISPQNTPKADEHVGSNNSDSMTVDEIKNYNFKAEFDGVLINPHDMMKKMFTQKLGQQSFLPVSKKPTNKNKENFKTNPPKEKDQSNNKKLPPASSSSSSTLNKSTPKSKLNNSKSNSNPTNK